MIAVIVLVDAFVRDFPSAKNTLLSLLYPLLLAGPWGAGARVKYYGSLNPTRQPANFEAYGAALQRNLREPGRLAALRGQIFASKAESVARLARVAVPAVRGLRSVVHCFTTLELSGGLGLPLDADESFRVVCQMQVAGLRALAEGRHIP